jgi:hypothetical protein
LAVTASSTARGTWGVNSFNSAYPGITLDGIANCYATTSLGPLPVGSAPGAMIWVGTIANPGSTNGQIVSYGTGAGTTRTIRQSTAGFYGVSDSSNTVSASASNFSPAIVYGDWSGTVENGYMNGAAFSGNPKTIGSLNTGATRLRVGANVSASPGGFTPSVVSDVMILSGVPSIADRQRLEGYFAWNRGLANVLPAKHPYKGAPP